jgi:hypothetical protein
MPRLNPRRDVLAGIAGVQGSFNFLPYPFPTFGGGAPLTASLVLLSIPAPPPMDAQLATWAQGDAAPTIFEEGANEWAADGGRWIARREGRGVYGSLGDLPAAGLPTPPAHAVGPDGTIAYVPDRQHGYGLVLVDPDGLAHDIPGIVPLDVQVLGAGQVLFRGGAYGRPVPVPALPDALELLLATVGDEDWIAYWSDALPGFVVQIDGAAEGYIIGTTPTFFNRDLRAINGELYIAWSTTQGEAPGDVGVQLIDRAAPRVALVPTPPDPEEPPVSTEPPDIEEPPPSTEPPPTTEPPDVEQPPTPEPEPPKGPVMLFIETKFEKTNPTQAVMKFEIIQNADGTESYRSVDRAASKATSKIDGKTVETPIYCVTDLGTDEWREHPGGAFESFRRVGTSLVADRPWSTAGGPVKQNAYVRYCVEVP